MWRPPPSDVGGPRTARTRASSEELGWNRGSSASRPEKQGRRRFFRAQREDVMAKTERKADHGDEALYAMRHSTAHVMAGAVLELFPGAKFGFGPPVQDGFYYDFELPRPLTPDDLAKIETKMRDVVKQDAPFEHREMSIPEAVKFFGERDQSYKVEQIQKLGGADTEDD